MILQNSFIQVDSWVVFFNPFGESQDKWVVDLQFWTREDPLLRKNEAKKESFEDDLTTFDY